MWKCLTTCAGGGRVESSWPAATRGPLRIDRCGARSNRRSKATIRSPIFKRSSRPLFVRRHVRETDDRTGLRFGLRPGADPTVQHVQIITLPRRHACQKSMRREMRSAHPFTVTRATSTLGMGRRIMAERRRTRTGRGRRYWVRAQARNMGRADDSAYASLCAFVRALARQAALECFELELKRRSPKTQ